MTAGVEIEARLRHAVEVLPRGLRDHVLRVEVECQRLARLYDVDPARARLAALGHDLVRHKKNDELLMLASQYELAPDEVERATPILVHGPVAARILERDYAFTDAEALAGIDCHTTARPDMTALEKVLFVADKIEPHKLDRYPDYREVYDLSLRELDAAVLRYLDLQLEQAARKHWLIHQRSLDARNQLLLASGAVPEFAG